MDISSKVTALDIVSIVLAVYGAALATYLARRDYLKSKKTIKIFLDQIDIASIARLTITNIGTRPITITEVAVFGGGESKATGVEPYPDLFYTGKETHNKYPFPVTLGDGGHVSVDLNEMVLSDLAHRPKSIRLVVYDAEGNEYEEFETRFFDSKSRTFRSK